MRSAVIAVAILAGPLGSAVAGDLSVDYRSYFRLVGSTPLESSHPHPSISVSGRYVFVTTTQGLHTVDVTDPTAPSILATMAPMVGMGSATVVGKLAVVGDYGLWTANISDPQSPRILGYLVARVFPDRIQVQGKRAYGATRSDGMYIFDLEDPETPQVLGHLPVNEPITEVRSLAVRGDYAYMARDRIFSSIDTFAVVDVRDPSKPTTVGVVALPLHSRPEGSLALERDLAYLGEGNHTVRVIDVSDPSTPTLVGAIRSESWALGIARGHLFAGGDRLLTVRELAPDPVSPPVVGKAFIPNFARAMALERGYAYVAADSAVHVFDARNPRSVPSVGSLDTGGSAEDVFVDGRLAYIADGQRGLQIVDVTDPRSPIALGSVATPTTAYGVTASGGHVFLADFEEGLQVVDVQDPSAPTILGSAPTRFAVDVAVDDNIAYVAGRGGLFTVVDVSDPSQPAVLASPAIGRGPRAVVLQGNLAYIAVIQGIEVFDVSDPRAPNRITTISAGRSNRDLVLSGDICFLAGEDGIEILDLKDVRAPVVLRKISTHRPAAGVWLHDGVLYAAVEDEGLVVIDVSDPRNATVVGRAPTENASSAVMVANGVVFVADRDAGLQVWPRHLPDPGIGRVARPTGSHGEIGSGVLSVDEPLNDGPNPFSDRTMLSLSLQAESRVEVAVFDVTGRLVRALVDGTLPRGSHTLTWDGRADGGVRVASGTYFVRLKVEDESQTRRVVYLGGK